MNLSEHASHARMYCLGKQVDGLPVGDLEVRHPGQPHLDLQPGDVVFFHSHALFSMLIRFGQRIRFWGSRRWMAYWNHCATVVAAADQGGGVIPAQIVEAIGHGAMLSPMSNYVDVEYARLRPPYPVDSVSRVVWCAQLAALRDYKYGFLQIVTCAFQLLTGSKLGVSYGTSQICSALVAANMEHGGVIFTKPATFLTPADLMEQLVGGLVAYPPEVA